MSSNPVRRGSLLAQRMQSIKSLSRADEGFWDDLNRRIKDGKVIPILSASVRLDGIISRVLQQLSAEGAAPEPAAAGAAAVPAEPAGAGPVDLGASCEDLAHSALEDLALNWADYIHYPLDDRCDLARVAQFHRVKCADAEQAKSEYLLFLKGALLSGARANPDTAAVTDELESQLEELSFASLAQELDYPGYPDPQSDPLRVLARLPLPIFITTSPFDFLERALQAEGKKPYTQICFWAGEGRNIASEHETNADLDPTPEAPLVYHLHGLERYPTTLVLSDDDYLDFLMRVSQDTDARQPVIPLYLRQALAESSLILLGFRLQDWDFRVLFRGVIKQSALRLFSLVIQLDPASQDDILNKDEARSYLQGYFGSSFKVEWGDTDHFIQKMWQEWDQWRRG